MSNEPKKLDYELFEYVIALNCTINDLYVSTIIDSIKLDYFDNQHIRIYLDNILTFYRERDCIPNTTEIKTHMTSDEQKGALRDVITRFKILDTSYNYDELICNTEQFIREKAVYQAVRTTVNNFTSDKAKDTGEIFKLFEDACNISLIDNIGFDYLERVDDHVKDITLVDKFIPTGYPWLNKTMGGGWLEGGRALYVFTGATNVGKSIVLGNCATQLLKQNKVVVLFTLEMPEVIYAKRISSQLSRIPFAILKTESDNLRTYLNDFKCKNPGAKLIIKEFPPNSISASHIKAYLKKLKQKYKIKPDAVIVDYLALMAATMPTGSMYTDGKQIAEEVRALSYPAFCGCPFITAAQLNREGMNEKSPGLSNISESVGVPFTSDAVISLYQEEQDKELGILKMSIKKNRFGVAFGTQAFRIDYDTLAIDETGDVFSDEGLVQSTDDLLHRLNNE